MSRSSIALFLVTLLAACVSPILRAAEPVAASAGIEGVEWVLTTLNGQPAAVADGRGAATLRLDAEKKQAGGFSGVNRYFGGYEREGDRLKFGALAGTHMAGPPAAMAGETAFLAALAATSHWRLDGPALELLHDGKVLARFTARLPAPK
jgi:heat shock protein HslJ